MNRYYLSAIFILLMLASTSCQTSKPFDSRKPVKEASESAVDEDTQVDKAAGVLKKGQTESGKQLAELEGETEADHTLRDLQKQQQMEEQKRLQRNITEDRVART